MRSYKIHIFEQISSTQIQLVEDIKSAVVQHPVMYLALRQDGGIGSNGRSWIDAQNTNDYANDLVLEQNAHTDQFPYNGGFFRNFVHSGDGAACNLTAAALNLRANVYLSFTHEPPACVNAANASIYYAVLVLKALRSLGSNAFVKWPNDLYLGALHDAKKIGGLITYRSAKCCVVGVGINIQAAPQGAGMLDIKPSLGEFLQALLEQLNNSASWREAFGIYAAEFHKSADYFINHEGEKWSLKDARLYQDGSILINNKRIYGQR